MRVHFLFILILDTEVPKWDLTILARYFLYARTSTVSYESRENAMSSPFKIHVIGTARRASHVSNL